MYRLMFTMILALSFTAGAAQAREFGGVQFDDSITVPGTTVPLQLNGVGYRTRFFFKIYIAALYTGHAVATRDDVIEQTGPKRVRMHFVYDEVEREKLVDAWSEGFEANTTKEQFDTLHERIERFNAMFPTVHKGDEVLLDVIPSEGTRVTINGEDKGMIQGEDFAVALLDIWLGDEPADENLKEALLGD